VNLGQKKLRIVKPGAPSVVSVSRLEVETKASGVPLKLEDAATTSAVVTLLKAIL
jgi:hypothetical protein